MTYSEFCNTTLPLAVEVYKDINSIRLGVMAQAALESGWGKALREYVVWNQGKQRMERDKQLLGQQNISTE